MSGISISKYYGLYQGLPAASGTLYVYQTGTTTPVTPYADALLVTPLTNPIVLDSNGCAVFYYSGTVNLKLVAYTASGTLIETLDPVYPNGASSANGVPWAIAGGTADIITATYNPVITALSDGLLLSFRASAANATTTPTFSPNGLTAYNITAFGGAALLPGNITANLAEYLVRYNLVNTRWELLNPTGVTGTVTTYQVTSAVDVVLSSAPTQANVGSAFSATIPAKGWIRWVVNCEAIAATAAAGVVLGLRIGSTNYWPVGTNFSGIAQYALSLAYSATGTANPDAIGMNGVAAATASSSSSPNNAQVSGIVGIFIERSGIPTGVQTVQLVAAMCTNGGSCTLKGTVVPTNVYIEIITG